MAISGLILIGCGGKDAPKPPESALLVFPLINSECTTGISISSTTSQVEFQWQAADHVETYELRASNLITNVTQTISTESLSAILPLEKGAPYSWSITSRNSNVSETATSEIWRFYNAGFETTYAPFSAEIIAPNPGTSVLKDINNEVLLDWSGADVDNDIDGYEVYFSNVSPPSSLIASPSFGSTEVKVSVISNTVYYWQVITRDREGNTSNSGIFEFKAL